MVVDQRSTIEKNKRVKRKLEEIGFDKFLPLMNWKGFFLLILEKKLRENLPVQRRFCIFYCVDSTLSV